jgi:site-specific recombinase XerD
MVHSRKLNVPSCSPIVAVSSESNTLSAPRAHAIKFYFEVVLGMPNRFYSVDRPRKDEKLPKVINKETVKEMIKLTNNLKYKCMISLLYRA